MTSSTFTDLINQLSSAAEDLNKASDTLNTAIRAIEEALAGYNIGVPAWAEACIIIISEGSLMVGYQKWSGKWRLMVALYTLDRTKQPEPQQQWALLEAPREIRVKAIQGLPCLVEKLTEEAKRMKAEITKGAFDAHTLALSIRPRTR